MPVGTVDHHLFRAVAIRLGLVALTLFALVAIALMELRPLSHAATGVLNGDHQVGPLGPGAALGQTFRTRFAVLDRAALHLLPMREDASGTVDLELLDSRTGAVLARRSVDVASIPSAGALVDALSGPIRVEPQDELELRVTVPQDQPGGVGSAARSGNPYTMGRAIRDGTAFESDLVFVAESSGDVVSTATWALDQLSRISGYGRAAPVIAAVAFGLMVASLSVILFVLIPWPRLSRLPHDGNQP